MFSRLLFSRSSSLVRATTVSSNGTLNRVTNNGLVGIGYPFADSIQMQSRSRWTKAKKKRVARFQRRQRLAEQGKSLTKPPYYFPKDTPVVNAVDMDEVFEEIKRKDADFAAELRDKLANKEPVLRFHMAGLKMSDRVRKLLSLHNGSQSEVVKAQKQRAMEAFQLRDGDTGSSAVQVVALTTRIQQLQTHFQAHKKDYHSKRGLVALQVRRRKLLDYMERSDFDSYRKVVKTLGLIR